MPIPPLPDTCSVTDFRERTADHLKRLKKTTRPTLLTHNGKAAAVVLSPKAYEELVVALDKADSIERIRESIAQGQRGEFKTVAQVASELERRFARRTQSKRRGAA